jgi:uncharacterized protein YjbI with pentapeptide repeats
VRLHADPTRPIRVQILECGPKLVANPEHLELLRQGVEVWNAWRAKEPSIRPDLSKANLSGANLSGADLTGAIMRGANLSETDLLRANLSEANLSGANLTGANLTRVSIADEDLFKVNLIEANLIEANHLRDLLRANPFRANLFRANLSEATLFQANLMGANIREANLSRAILVGAALVGADLTGAILIEANLMAAVLSLADLTGADLTGARLVAAQLIETNLVDATLTNCIIYGISAWNVKSERTKQQGLTITPNKEPAITVDDLEVAQFVYLILRNAKIRDVIDTINSKVVLILGCFTEKRKAVLDAIREALRKRNYVPILFDFAVPAARDITETVSLLARMARFIIADLTDPSSIPKELEAIIPQVAVPVQPLLEGASRPYGMFTDNWKYEWVLPVYRYEGLDQLLTALTEKVIGPAEAKMNALAERRRAFEAELTKSR